VAFQGPKPQFSAPLSARNLLALLAPDLDKAAGLAREAKAKATRRAYASDFQLFAHWCASRGANALPATVGACRTNFNRHRDYPTRPLPVL